MIKWIHVLDVDIDDTGSRWEFLSRAESETLHR
jgi:hypothetical protein